MLRFKVILFSLFLISGFGCSKTSNNPQTTQGLNNSAKVSEAAEQETPFKPFSVYTDKYSLNNHFVASGWMPGPGTDKDLKYEDKEIENPHSGSTCIEIEYKDVSGNRWVGIYWQNPANNWGSKKGGFDLTGATSLKFWARGENGGERIEEFKIGGLTGEYPDSDTAAIGPVILTKEWKEYTIDLRGKDLSYISGGFCWSTNIDVNPAGAKFYLDDIVYE